MKELSLLFPLMALACGGSAAQAPTDGPDETPSAVSVQAVYYQPGEAWDPQQPPEQQNLAAHLDYVGEHAARGELVANGLFSTAPLGLYLIAGGPEAAQSFIAADPAVADGVLVHEHTDPWMVLMSQLETAGAGDAVFVLRYGPGPSWSEGRPLAEQAVGPHLEYVGSAFGAGTVLAGGPIGDGATGGMYVIDADSLEAANAFVASDPGAASGLFSVSVNGWTLMNVSSL